MSKLMPTKRSTHLWDPFADFDDLFGTMFRGTGLDEARKNAEKGLVPMRINFSENDKAYSLSAELPGVEKDHLDINIEDGVLTIQGEKKEESETQEDNFHRVERSYGSFYRKMSLPADVDESHVDAKFENGVLRMTLPKLKTANTQAKKITVK